MSSNVRKTREPSHCILDGGERRLLPMETVVHPWASKSPERRSSAHRFGPSARRVKRRWVVRYATLLILVFGAVTGLARADVTGKDSLLRLLRRTHRAIKADAHATLEPIVDLAGGRRRGPTWVAATAAGFALRTAPLGGWRGGKFDVQVMGLVRGLPHESQLVGDAQGVSNLYNSFSFLRLLTFSYRQRLQGPLLMRVGIMDVNDYFDTSAPASDLINSSFGMTPTLTVDVPLTPTAPYTGWGGMIRGGVPSDRWRLAVFSGDPAARGTVIHQGFFAIGEWQFRPFVHQRVKLGAWTYHNAEGPSLGSLASPRSTSGFYGIWESHERKKHPRGLAWGWFLETGLNPDRVTPISYYVGVGFRLRGIAYGHPRTALTAGVAHVGIRGRVGETAWEVAYDDHVGAGWILEPDLQYVMHPSGVYADALVGIFRIRKDF